MADDKPYSTDLSEMRNLIDRAGTIGQSIEGYLDQIQKQVAAMHVDWKGKAATAHADAHQRWLAAARDMHCDLMMLRGETTRAHGIYSGVVEHNDGMWPSI